MGDRFEERSADIARLERFLSEGEAEPVEEHSLHLALGNRYRGVGTYLAVDGDSAALTHFEWAAAHYLRRITAARPFRHELEGATWENETMVYVRALNCALISMDTKRIRQIAAHTRTLDDEYLDRWEGVFDDSAEGYYYVRTFAETTLETDEAQTYHTKLAEVSDDERLLGYLDALLSNDSERVVSSIETYANKHDADHESPEGPSELVCWSAAAFLVLAWRRGHDVAVEADCIPDLFYEYRDNP